MPTTEEIKKIAVAYSVSRPADEMPTNPAMAQMIVSDALRWLCKTYCIVPKSKVKEEYEVGGLLQYSNNREDKGAGMSTQTLLIRLFGTALFNEEKK